LQREKVDDVLEGTVPLHRHILPLCRVGVLKVDLAERRGRLTEAAVRLPTSIRQRRKHHARRSSKRVQGVPKKRVERDGGMDRDQLRPFTLHRRDHGVREQL